MASAGAWDPWETHYGEVARQILVRNDPMDLWWRPGNGGPDWKFEGRFMSKPPLAYWCMAFSMKIFGVGTSPDPAEMVRPFWPELAIRLPSMLVGLASAGFLGYVVWRQVSLRAGLFVALVLVTMPQWAIATRQALTDLFFVGPVVLGVGAWALAWLEEDRELRTRGKGWKRIPWDRAYLVFLVLLLLAAIVPLLVLHGHVVDGDTIARVRTWKASASFLDRLHTISLHFWVYWAIAVAALVGSLRWRRRSQACMGVVYLAAGLSVLGKGFIGPALIGVMCLAHLAVTGRWNILRRCGLLVGVLLFVLVCFPWHHGMIIFRGERFVHEWIVQNNLQRFATGEQKHAVGSFVFYARTIGLAAFPWAAGLPLALWYGIRSFRPGGDREPKRQSAVDLHRFAMLWFVLSLWLITYAVTKYYHYLLPALPPLAVLTGLWLDRLLGPKDETMSKTLVIAAGAILGLSTLALVVREALHEPAWLAHLTTYLYTGMWKKGAPPVDRLAWVCAPFGLGLILLTIRRKRAAVAAMALSAVLTTTYVLADYLPATSEAWSQRSAMRTYFERRGPNDRLVSWWFYYRGETYFSKADIWVMKNPDRKKVAELIKEHEGKGATLWFVTTAAHGKRLKSHLPHKHRADLEVAYESFHYMLLALPVP
jgi:4-amino-4-deoxy-L-arabinose transferase-like glycosyltransferase